MSAIREALKKARAQSPATVTGNNGFHLPPGEHPRAASRSPFLVSLLLAFLLMGGGLVLLQDRASRKKSAPPQPPSATLATPIAVPPDSSPDLLPVVARANSTANEPTLGETTPTPSAAITDSSPSTLAPPPEPEPIPAYPKLRLQGIFYRQGDPFVIINSQTLAVGDTIQDVLVTAITPDSVTLRWNDEIKTLTLR